MGKYPAETSMFKKKYIVIGVLLLVIAIVFLACLNRPQDTAEPGTIRITCQGELVKSLTLEELQALPKVEMEKTISSSNSPNETGVFSGVDLVEVLKAADPALIEDCTRVIAKANDGFVASYDKDEILRDGNILVVYAKDNKPLEGADAGGTGPLRIVVISDPFGNRCTKHLSELEVQ